MPRGQARLDHSRYPQLFNTSAAAGASAQRGSARRSPSSRATPLRTQQLAAAAVHACEPTLSRCAPACTGETGGRVELSLPLASAQVWQAPKNSAHLNPASAFDRLKEACCGCGLTALPRPPRSLQQQVRRSRFVTATVRSAHTRIQGTSACACWRLQAQGGNHLSWHPNLAPPDIPLPAVLNNEDVSPLAGRWFVREQPYSFDLFLENVLDPVRDEGGWADGGCRRVCRATPHLSRDLFRPLAHWRRIYRPTWTLRTTALQVHPSSPKQPFPVFKAVW